MRYLLYVSLASAFAISAQAQEKAPPKYVTNKIGMKFVWIPPGNFTMGSSVDELNTNDENGLQLMLYARRKVTLTKGFYLGVYTVTQEEWLAVMDKNPSEFRGEKKLPVDRVSWEDCHEFMTKLWEKDKKPYRLPTEAEWEYACRAGTTTPFHTGKSISTDQANYDGDYPYADAPKGKNRGKPTPVGSFPPNAFGLYDMHGNVFQWCQDWYEPYAGDNLVDPQGSATPWKLQDGTFAALRVARGNSWGGPARSCRAAYRNNWSPDMRRYDLGFRVAFTLQAVPQPPGPATGTTTPVPPPAFRPK